MAAWEKHGDKIDGDFWTVDFVVNGEPILKVMVSKEDGRWSYQITGTDARRRIT